jgi:hypothetical protein
MTPSSPDPLRAALADSWEASARQIDERTAFGDPAANIAAANTLRFCANRLRAALAAQPAPAPGLDVEWLAEALWESSDNSEEGPWIDASEDQRATALEWTRAIVAEYARLSKDSTDDPE